MIKFIYFLLAIFLIAWTPYSIVSCITAFLSADLVSPLGSLLPAIFAKSSMAMSPVFFTFSSRNIYRKLFYKKSIIYKSINNAKLKTYFKTVYNLKYSIL